MTQKIAMALLAAALVLGSAAAPARCDGSGTQGRPEERQGAAARPTGSLFSPEHSSLFADLKAHRVGDIVTILVQESAVATTSANTKTSKDESATFGGVTGALSGLFKPLGIKHSLLGPFGTNDKRTSNGSGTTDRSGSLVTKITAVVKEVMPNGDLKIEGNRVVGINQEKQKVTISGIVRPQDVGPDNTVSSVSIAEMTVQYDGKGPVGAQQKPGLITRLFHWLF
ncbi:MAG: flagellar basal body L-ring protein FlgH [Chthonomonadales bacterium]